MRTRSFCIRAVVGALAASLFACVVMLCLERIVLARDTWEKRERRLDERSEKRIEAAAQNLQWTRADLIESRHQAFCVETCRAVEQEPLQHADAPVEELGLGTSISEVVCRCLSSSPDGRFKQIRVYRNTSMPMLDREAP